MSIQFSRRMVAVAVFCQLCSMYSFGNDCSGKPYRLPLPKGQSSQPDAVVAGPKNQAQVIFVTNDTLTRVTYDLQTRTLKSAMFYRDTCSSWRDVAADSMGVAYLSRKNGYPHQVVKLDTVLARAENLVLDPVEMTSKLVDTRTVAAIRKDTLSFINISGKVEFSCQIPTDFIFSTNVIRCSDGFWAMGRGGGLMQAIFKYTPDGVKVMPLKALQDSLKVTVYSRKYAFKNKLYIQVATRVDPRSHLGIIAKRSVVYSIEANPPHRIALMAQVNEEADMRSVNETGIWCFAAKHILVFPLCNP